MVIDDGDACASRWDIRRYSGIQQLLMCRAWLGAEGGMTIRFEKMVGYCGCIYGGKR
jgi:hypothetical protein